MLPIGDFAVQMRSYVLESRERSYTKLTATPVDDPALVRELYSACRVVLKSYIIPEFVVVSVIPLNPSGKVDERGLSTIIKASFRSDPDDITHPVNNVVNRTEDLGDILATIVSSRFFSNKPSVTDHPNHYGLTSFVFIRFFKDV